VKADIAKRDADKKVKIEMVVREASRDNGRERQTLDERNWFEHNSEQGVRGEAVRKSLLRMLSAATVRCKMTNAMAPRDA